MTTISVFFALWLYASRHTCEPNPAVQKTQSQRVKETQRVTGMEESTWKYYICDDFIAVYLQKATNNSAQKHTCDHIIRFTGIVYFRKVDK